MTRREGRRSARALSSDVPVAAVLCALKVAIDLSVLHTGFSHVSDDDYARTVIAQQFAHAPRLDPSGTSWLPLPFWVAGAAMDLVGRSLEAARVVAIALGAAAVAAPFAAMRAMQVPRRAAAAATMIAMALPWSAWLGAATVPDGWTAALIAAGVIAMPEARARPWCAAALVTASLARYEAWAACGVWAVFSTTSVRGKTFSRRDLACLLAVLAGPLLWMAWNAHAHGSPFHFVARVSAFRRAIGAADVPLHDKVLGYPTALIEETPEAVVLGACGIAGLVASPGLRRRWGWAAASALAILVFLIAGDLGDGAPTHHPARALGGVVWILVGMGVDALAVAMAAAPSRALRSGSASVTAVVAFAWVMTLRDRWAVGPGESAYDRRDVQIARGLDLRERGTPSAEITPCAFEHFALLAAWGEPERARINPRTGAPLTDECPRVTVP